MSLWFLLPHCGSWYFLVENFLFLTAGLDALTATQKCLHVCGTEYSVEMRYCMLLQLAEQANGGGG
jgi:hypothetical protein